MYGTLIEEKSLADPKNGSTTSAAEGQKSQGDRTKKLTNKQQVISSDQKNNKKIISHCHFQSSSSSPSSLDDHNYVGHEHSRSPQPNSQIDKSARKRLITASIICLVFMIAEVVGGYFSNSLAIATDAAHLLTDFAGFMISLFALWLATRPATKRMSFGWYRAEVIGALLSVLMIWLVTGLLVYLAIERMQTREFEIDTLVMVITASAGLLVNIIMALALNIDGHSHGFSHHHHHHGGTSHSHKIHLDQENSDRSHRVEIVPVLNKHQQGPIANNIAKPKSNNQNLGHDSRSNSEHIHRQPKERGRGKENINVRAAFIHVVGDFLQSLGVLIAALVIHYEPSYAIIDPICTFLFSFIVLLTTLGIIKDAINVLMEGIPDGINFLEIQSMLNSLPHVVRVHNLRIWSLSLDKIALSTHLVIDGNKTSLSETLIKAIQELKSIHNFFDVTIQIEEYREDMDYCEHCRDEDSPTNTSNLISEPAAINSSQSGVYLANDSRNSQSIT